jgi:hypothetical protein
MPGEGLPSYIDLLSATYPSARGWLTPSEQKRRSELNKWLLRRDEKSEI